VALFPVYILSGTFGLLGVFCRKQFFLILVWILLSNALRHWYDIGEKSSCFHEHRKLSPKHSTPKRIHSIRCLSPLI
jgi:hypothetical protein